MYFERHQRKKGWIFWGCFHGHTKGPDVFWEKDWGSINQESYCQHTVPIIHGYLELIRRLPCGDSNKFSYVNSRYIDYATIDVESV